MLVSFSMFREAVENGIAEANGLELPHPGVAPKRQTVRAERADGRAPKVGELAHLWWKSRTPARAKLGALPIETVLPISIHEDGYLLSEGFHEVYGDYPGCDRTFAKADGFESWAVMWEWFGKTHGYPFRGWIIRW